MSNQYFLKNLSRIGLFGVLVVVGLMACREAEPPAAVPPTAIAPIVAPTNTPRPTPTVGLTPVANTIVPANLTAYYPFSGNANDASGFDIHGKVHGATLVADRFGNADSAYYFDGIDDYIDVPNMPSNAPTLEASLSLWFLHETQADTTWYSLIEKSHTERDGHSRYGMWVKEDFPEFCVQPADLNLGQRCVTSEAGLNAGIWHHLVATSDGSTIRIYVDSVLTGERTFGRSAIANTPFELFFGTDLYNFTTAFTKGTMDDIRIYKRMLTDQEILTLFEATE